MKSKKIIHNIQDKLISSIKKVEQEGNDSNFNQKQEVINEKFKDSFNEIVNVLEEMARGRVDSSDTDIILSQIEEEFGYAKNAIGRSLQREIENKDESLDLEGLLNHLVTNLGDELEEISELEESVDISETDISQNFTRVQVTIDDVREDSYKSACNKFNYEVEDTIMTDLKYKINSILSRSGMSMSVDMDELQYHVNRILSTKLLEPILNDSQEIDNMTLEKAGIDEDTILSEIYTEISDLTGQEKEGSEKEVEDPSDEFQKELMGEVKSNEEMFHFDSVVEEESQERTVARDDLDELSK